MFISTEELFIKENKPSPTGIDVARDARNSQKSLLITRESRECYVAREAYAAPLSFQDDSSKNPADWIEIIALCYELRGRLKYIWAHFPVSIPVGSRKQPVHLTCVRIDVFFEPSVIRKKQCL